jgi:hypothetical protein
VESSQVPCLVILRRELTNVLTIYRSINKREERTQMASYRLASWKFSKWLSDQMFLVCRELTNAVSDKKKLKFLALVSKRNVHVSKYFAVSSPC